MSKLVIYHFTVETPTPEDPALAMLWFGGPLKLSKNSGRVWLTRPGGGKVLEVEKSKVHPLTKQQVVQAMQDEVTRSRTRN